MHLRGASFTTRRQRCSVSTFFFFWWLKAAWEGAREQRGLKLPKSKRGWGALKEVTEMGKEGKRNLLIFCSVLDYVLNTYTCICYLILLVIQFIDEETETQGDRMSCLK